METITIVKQKKSPKKKETIPDDALLQLKMSLEDLRHGRVKRVSK